MEYGAGKSVPREKHSTWRHIHPHAKPPTYTHRSFNGCSTVTLRAIGRCCYPYKARDWSSLSAVMKSSRRSITKCLLASRTRASTTRWLPGQTDCRFQRPLQSHHVIRPPSGRSWLRMGFIANSRPNPCANWGGNPWQGWGSPRCTVSRQNS